MKKQILLPVAFLIATILFAFSPKGDETVSLIRHGKDTEYLIHLKKVKDSLSLKLSDFASDFEFIRLETHKECLLFQPNPSTDAFNQECVCCFSGKWNSSV
jgi:hypothetical protein